MWVARISLCFMWANAALAALGIIVATFSIAWLVASLIRFIVHLIYGPPEEAEDLRPLLQGRACYWSPTHRANGYLEADVESGGQL